MGLPWLWKQVLAAIVFCRSGKEICAVYKLLTIEAVVVKKEERHYVLTPWFCSSESSLAGVCRFSPHCFVV